MIQDALLDDVMKAAAEQDAILNGAIDAVFEGTSKAEGKTEVKPKAKKKTEVKTKGKTEGKTEAKPDLKFHCRSDDIGLNAILETQNLVLAVHTGTTVCVWLDSV